MALFSPAFAAPGGRERGVAVDRIRSGTMEETGAPVERTTVGVTLAAEHLPWLTREVASRGGQVILGLRPLTLLRERAEACPLTPAEQEAVRVMLEQNTWDAAAREAEVSEAALRARLRSARQRLGVGTEARLIAICLARGWVPAPPG
jgi:predicted DNA-binding protein (UPF0251 family)